MWPFWRTAWDLQVIRSKFDVALTIMIDTLQINNTVPANRARVFLEAMWTDNRTRPNNGLDALRVTLGDSFPAWRPRYFQNIASAGPLPANNSRSIRLYLRRKIRLLETHVRDQPGNLQVLDAITPKLDALIFNIGTLPTLMPGGVVSPRDTAFVQFLTFERNLSVTVRDSFNELLDGLQTWGRADALRVVRRQAALAAGPLPIVPVPPHTIANRQQYDNQLTLWERHQAALRSINNALVNLSAARATRSDVTTQAIELQITALQINTAAAVLARVNDIITTRTNLRNAYQAQDNAALWHGDPVSPWEQRGQPIGGLINGMAGGHGTVDTWVKLDANGAVIDVSYI